MKKSNKVVDTPFGKVTVKYDPSMKQYEGKVLFPEKLAKAKEALENTNMREIIEKHLQERQAAPSKEISDNL